MTFIYAVCAVCRGGKRFGIIFTVETVCVRPVFLRFEKKREGNLIQNGLACFR